MDRHEDVEAVTSETQVKPGYSLTLVGPDGVKIWERPLSGGSFEDHDALFCLGEQIIEALPEEAFELCKEEPDEKTQDNNDSL